jgi:hypothetical protein
MRRCKLRRDLAALGLPKWTPSDETRDLVRVYAYNRTPHERIAHILGIELQELRIHFSKELGYGEEILLAWSAANVMKIASKVDSDPKAALSANMAMLQSRSRHWRIPTSPEAESDVPVERMTLEQTERAIAELTERLRTAAEGAGEAQDGPEVPAEPG